MTIYFSVTSFEAKFNFFRNQLSFNACLLFSPHNLKVVNLKATFLTFLIKLESILKYSDVLFTDNPAKQGTWKDKILPEVSLGFEDPLTLAFPRECIEHFRLAQRNSSKVYLLQFFKINPFVPDTPFLYPLKTSDNLTVL